MASLSFRNSSGGIKSGFCFEVFHFLKKAQGKQKFVLVRKADFLQSQFLAPADQSRKIHVGRKILEPEAPIRIRKCASWRK